jgi:hypothetical protein
VLPTLEAVGMGLDAMIGSPPGEKQLEKLARDIRQGRRRLARHSERLLGKAPPNRDMRIMVTLPALTDKDLRDLDFVAGESDLVGYSFLREAVDMDRLGTELETRGAGDMGRIAKIENRQAVVHLPGHLSAS